MNSLRQYILYVLRLGTPLGNGISYKMRFCNSLSSVQQSKRKLKTSLFTASPHAAKAAFKLVGAQYKKPLLLLSLLGYCCVQRMNQLI